MPLTNWDSAFPPYPHPQQAHAEEREEQAHLPELTSFNTSPPDHTHYPTFRSDPDILPLVLLFRRSHLGLLSRGVSLNLSVAQFPRWCFPAKRPAPDLIAANFETVFALAASIGTTRPKDFSLPSPLSLGSAIVHDSLLELCR